MGLSASKIEKNYDVIVVGSGAAGGQSAYTLSMEARAAGFFARYRDLTVGGFYSIPAGHRDLGYIGNVPQLRFDWPPVELLRKLGLGPEAA